MSHLLFYIIFIENTSTLTDGYSHLHTLSQTLKNQSYLEFFCDKREQKCLMVRDQDEERGVLNRPPKLFLINKTPVLSTAESTDDPEFDVQI